MAQAYTTQDGITLIDPGTYVSTTVIPGQGNTASSGVVTIIGEADEGPGFLDEADLSAVAFTPDQIGRVIAKYGSGRLVDAFSKIISAANDPNILGGVSLVRLVKTNISAKASSALQLRKNTLPTFATGQARREGLPGNLIKYQSAAAVVEIAPSTGLITFAPQITGSISVALRVNGGAKMSHTISAKTAPDALVTALESVTNGLQALGGKKKLVIPLSGITLSATALDANTLQVSLPSGSLWANLPAIGDTAVIPLLGDYGAAQNSVIAGAGQANVGTYIVQAVTNTATSATLTLKKVATQGTLVSASGSTDTDLSDLILYSQIELNNVTGDSRHFMDGVFGTYNVTLNNGSQISITAPANWNVTPTVGDVLSVPAAFGTVQAGFYVITSATANTLSALRTSEGSSGSGTGSVSYSLDGEPISILEPVVTGLGKTLSIEGTVSSIFLHSDGTDANLSNARLISAAEYRNLMTISKGDISNQYKAGGDIVLEVGCSSESATVSVLADRIDFAVASTVQFSCSFKQFKTLNDVAAFINTQTGWTAGIASSRFSAANPTQLDEGVFTASSGIAAKTCRLKRDAYDWSQTINADGLTQWTVALSGLPEPTATATFLQNGAKNGTTSALVTSAIDACQSLDTNLVVHTFSDDSTNDITAGETESTSTYTIDAINAYLKSHVLLMSEIEMRKNRLALGSKVGDYATVKEAAGSIASFRFAMAFQPIKDATADGTPKLFQPWMAAIVAAGMTAAAGYKGIVKKFANISGIGTVSGFDPSSPGDRKDALKTGLLVMERVPTGGFRWVSDQTTYSVDNNFVYNSIQAVYISDLMALTLIDRFDRLAVGKSVAELSAQAALGILDAEMFNFKRLRWITTSDDAPKGYKNATADLIGGALVISVEAKIAGLIYFVPIALSLSQVTQSAQG